MSISTIINYDNPSNFTFDTSKIEISVSKAQLKSTEPNAGLTFNQPFTSSAGFTFDSAKTQFTGSQMEAIDQRPSNATFFASFTTDEDGNWGDGVLTGTLDGSTTIDSGYVKMSNTLGDGLHWAALNNADSQQTGCVRFVVQTQYSGAPTNTQVLWYVSKTSALVNSLAIVHQTGAGNIRITCYDQAGVNNTFDLGNWSPTSGVDYEFELNWDFTGGASRLFIDGTQFGSTSTLTQTRSSDINDFALGDGITSNQTPNFWIKDIVMFDAVQHTTTYSAPSTVPSETIYLEDLITLPTFTYSGVGDIQAFTNFVTTETGTVQYIINDEYWNGSAWVASDGSRSQSNAKATLLANISSITLSDTVVLKVRTTDSNVKDSIDDLTLTYTGSQYWTDSPTITTIGSIGMEELTSYANSVTTPGSDTIKWSPSINGIFYYWTGSAWATADGTVTQSNTAADINTNASSFPVSPGKIVTFKAFLTSAAGTTTPDITSLTVTYDFFTSFSEPTTCLVYGFVLNMSAEPVEGATVRAYRNSHFEYGDDVVLQEKTVITDSTGYWEMILVETATPSTTMDFRISFIEDGKKEIEDILGKTIPNSPSVAFTSLA